MLAYNNDLARENTLIGVSLTLCMHTSVILGSLPGASQTYNFKVQSAVTWSSEIAGSVSWVADAEGSLVMPVAGENMKNLSKWENHPGGLE